MIDINELGFECHIGYLQESNEEEMRLWDFTKEIEIIRETGEDILQCVDRHIKKYYKNEGMILQEIPTETTINTRDLEKILERTYGGSIKITFEDFRDGQYVEQRILQTREGKPNNLLFRYLSNPKHNQMKVLIKNLIYDYVEDKEHGSINYMGNLANG